MAMIKCPECGREISSLAPVCLGCGITQETVQKLLAERQEISQSIAEESSALKEQSTPVKTIVQPAVHTEKVQIRPAEKQNRTIRCVICRNTYHSADTAVCPKCKYPVLSPERNSRKIKQEIRTYRKQNGYQSLELTIGQTYRMGRYQGEEITWKVLAVEEDKALLLSEKGLDAKRYNEKRADVTWETCTLRKWLNTEFLNSAFSAEDRNKIAVTKVRAEKNPVNDTDFGNDTEDKIFLLSIQEMKKYIDDNEGRKAVPTEFAKKNGAFMFGSTGYCWWWLRSPGHVSYFAACVNQVGAVGYDGLLVNFDFICVRPALWVNL